jgi:hypothetical protein
MPQGDREIAVGPTRLLHRQHLRIRTVAVSFEAAVASAHHDHEGSPAERDAMIEVWRQWTLEQLERYESELDLLGEDHPELGPALEELRVQLAESTDTVRRA